MAYGLRQDNFCNKFLVVSDREIIQISEAKEADILERRRFPFYGGLKLGCLTMGYMENILSVNEKLLVNPVHLT